MFPLSEPKKKFNLSAFYAIIIYKNCHSKFSKKVKLFYIKLEYKNKNLYFKFKTYK